MQMRRKRPGRPESRGAYTPADVYRRLLAPAPMIDFLRDLFSRPGAARTVILLDPDTMSAPRQYEVRPGAAVYAAVLAVVAGAAVLVAAVVMTPLRGLLLGPDAGELRAAAEHNAARAPPSKTRWPSRSSRSAACAP